MTDTPLKGPTGSPAQKSIAQLVAPLRSRAKTARTRHEVTGPGAPLTPELLAALEPLLDTRTPDEALKHDEGDYVNVHLLWQVRCMDAVLGRSHWCWRIHYENDETARAYVVIGNALTGIRIDRVSGELIIPPEAELLIPPYEGSGGVGTLDTRGATRKAARTSALRGLLSLIGPGGDVSMLTRTYPSRRTPVAHAGGASPDTSDVSRPASPPRLEAVTDPQEQAATRLLLREIRGLAGERGIPASQLATLIGEAMDHPVKTLPEQEAEWRVAVMLDSPVIRLTEDQTVKLRALVEQAAPHLPVIARAQGGEDGAQDPAEHADAA